jgi:hypothetical protein
MEHAQQPEKVQEESIPKPMHCLPDVHPSQSVHKFANIRFFSNFDSGNLMKVVRQS